MAEDNSKTNGEGKTPVTEFMTTSSKLTDIKLDGDGENYVEWKYLVAVSLGGMGKDEHLTGSCPTNATAAAKWKMDDKRILALLVNSVDKRTQSVITHCQTVKELWEFLQFIFGKADNLNRIYALLQ
ncbi:uncharacterized protein LOC130733916 [Lotus japonicus]|uniref:uncharacterized protein LOC130733916 n=1 Tax=Lotus japonicus TaxID=34305 RepID=UPI002587805B|nr:uncharacterized protein LOC130733916 [Lotus japonicus]